MHRYKELKVWNKAIDPVSYSPRRTNVQRDTTYGIEFSLKIYKLTGKFPLNEKYTLTSQLRPAAVSVPSNIAEGAGRKTDGEFVHFLGISNGSTCEVDAQLIIANRLAYINKEEYKVLKKHLEHIQNMIYKLQRKIK